MAEPVAIKARGWGWRHPGRRAWALRGLDLRIEPGERVMLLGASGSGKSTLLMGLAGLLEGGESEGDLRVDGRDPRTARDRTGLVFQDPESQLVMARAGDEVAFGLENRCVPPSDIWPRVDEALRAVGFPYDRDRSTDALSGGEQQRLALAGTLALRPGLLLLDEPTANLDPEGAALLRASLARANEPDGATLILVEHRVAEALDLVHRVVVLAAGAGVIADGKPAEVFARHGAEMAEAGIWVPDHPLPRTRRPAGMSSEPMLSALGIGYRFPGETVLAMGPMDLELWGGEALAVVGANGSGKTTLSLLLGGLLPPAAGSLRIAPELVVGLGPRWDREPPWRWPAPLLAGRIGSVFQDPEHQFLAGRVTDELTLAGVTGATPGAAVRRRAGELLDRLHLDHLANANPFTLSGGEKRRLSVATALMADPRVLILDEPTFGQDRRTAIEMLRLLAEIRDQGRAVCMVTHDAAFADALADRTVRLVPAAGAGPQ